MSQPEDGVQSLEVAAQRFRQGMCPGCGKRAGEPRGLEYRAKSEDLYCHTCRKSWPIELDLDVLRRELSTLSPTQTKEQAAPTPGAVLGRPKSEAPVRSSGLWSFFRRLLKRR